MRSSLRLGDSALAARRSTTLPQNTKPVTVIPGAPGVPGPSLWWSKPPMIAVRAPREVPVQRPDPDAGQIGDLLGGRVHA
jgi:hypothetical protein